MQRIGRRDVADIAPGAGEQRAVFETRQAGTDGGHSVSSGRFCFGWRTLFCHRRGLYRAIRQTSAVSTGLPVKPGKDTSRVRVVGQRVSISLGGARAQFAIALAALATMSLGVA
jgi:hypothetical protein